MIEFMNKLNRTTVCLQQELGRDPTDTEVAAKLELPLHLVVRALRVPGEPLSFSESDESETSIAGLEDRSEAIDEVLAVRVMQRRLRTVIGNLKKNQPDVIRMRFGIDHPSDETLEEIGQRFCVTRERIRQIEGKALGVLESWIREDAILSEFAQ
jgi:RNA polymerase primary sigma factor